MKKIICMFACLFAVAANAGLIAEYDYATATASTSLGATFVDVGYSASSLSLNNSSTTSSSFSNHFYHNGWGASFDNNKYYESTLSSVGSYQLTDVDFSLENTGGTSSYWLRSSLDGFASNLSTGIFLNGLVTDFSVDLSSLGSLSSPVSFRWFIASSSVAGFANHQVGGAGGGLSDVGQDLAFYGDSVSVPEPTSLALLGLALAGIGFSRKKKTA